MPSSRLARLGARASYLAAGAAAVAAWTDALLLPDDAYVAGHAAMAGVLLLLAGATAVHVSASQRLLGGEGAPLLEILTTGRCIVEVGAASGVLAAVRAFREAAPPPLSALHLHRLTRVADPVAQLLAVAWVVALLSATEGREALSPAARRAGAACAAALGLAMPLALLLPLDPRAERALDAASSGTAYPLFLLLVGRSLARAA